MLVALGFLLATLIAVLLAPAYRARAMRLTYKHMRRVMPLTESELLLDRDRLRAHYAVRIHELETKLEKLRLAAARQQVEVNRRDATISALESELARIRAELEENVNARRVLEQTVMDRLPAVEQRLAETRKLLEQRDRELATITADTSKNARALDEVMQINAQQRAEIERLNAVIATRGLRTNRGSRDPRFENELALRSELEALRAKTREQESLISRLQTLVTMPSQAGQAGRANGGGSSTEQEAELDRLRRDLVEAESALKSIAEQSDGKEVADETMRARLQSLENLVADQTAKIKRLEAALAVYEKGDGDGRAISLKDSKIAMKARIASLQAEPTSAPPPSRSCAPSSPRPTSGLLCRPPSSGTRSAGCAPVLSPQRRRRTSRRPQPGARSPSASPTSTPHWPHRSGRDLTAPQGAKRRRPNPPTNKPPSTTPRNKLPRRS